MAGAQCPMRQCQTFLSVGPPTRALAVSGGRTAVQLDVDGGGNSLQTIAILEERAMTTGTEPHVRRSQASSNSVVLLSLTRCPLNASQRLNVLHEQIR